MLNWGKTIFAIITLYNKIIICKSVLHIYIKNRAFHPRLRNKRWWTCRRWSTVANAKTRQILIFCRKITKDHYQSKKRAREKRRDMLRRILFTRQIDGPESSLNALGGPFFRYHYTEEADASAASLSVTLREATTRWSPLFPPLPRTENGGREQSSLYKRHTKPFESWEPFSPALLLLSLLSVFRLY